MCENVIMKLSYIIHANKKREKVDSWINYSLLSSAPTDPVGRQEDTKVSLKFGLCALEP